MCVYTVVFSFQSLLGQLKYILIKNDMKTSVELDMGSHTCDLSHLGAGAEAGSCRFEASLSHVGSSRPT